MTWNKNEWPIERIRTLPRKGVLALRENCLGRKPEIVAACDKVLADGCYAPEPHVKRNGNDTGSKIKSERRDGLMIKLPFSPDAVDRVAKLLLQLPLADTIPNGRARRELQKAPVETLGDLWRLFVVCGFSSRENSEDDGNLALFLADDGPLLDLEKIRVEDCKPEWVRSQIEGHRLSFTKIKVKLIVGNFAHFEKAGKAGDRLADLCYEEGALKLFCDLARGTVDDRDLDRSAAFSKRLDHTHFTGIGDKQLRNILVNGGLARNVVPLDSRWMGYLQGIVPEDYSLTPARYLLLEDLLRRALISVQDRRADIVNLAVLDAVVFAGQSKKGVSRTGWFGMHRPGNGDAAEDDEAVAA
ncbi:hypothetical protein [Burkholderia vietnamiensis]|uniref:hypothetical protein n=1 Tax=Burkholderia vietnamiensis TaxID=60552 RepID=UPI001B911925|nr:hypothetical protein [Burkholderia vietnamiensis]MBR8219222.1 hypothetical protein [Burkholderia vietnamiensis]MBR8284792.1 hypothetical protein [Burkholderia vietnamiensis]MCA8016564.1 hypothetical protein [Burkholderia vietnamiensis]HDR8941875.1 hypothetical protein [Burkholderia vietnamiensis]HDR9265983.1 hypothetical protein [Burkholderia vietnamiensis]